MQQQEPLQAYHKALGEFVAGVVEWSSEANLPYDSLLVLYRTMIEHYVVLSADQRIRTSEPPALPREFDDHPWRVHPDEVRAALPYAEKK